MTTTDSRLPELLAPAGGPEAGYAAIQYGADALYVGLRRFSARAEAVNFSPDELADLCGYAHGRERRRRIYVTLNTVALAGELPQLVPVLADVEAAGADGVIVQDLGLARLARRHFPRLELHASTQMAIHNLQGAKKLKDLGFVRVNLARELELEEVRRIAAESGLEVEVFVHGALCYCYSGMCLMSSHLYGRSGNRGRCAYPCRDWFDAEDGGRRGGLAFSMKDLALPDRLPELRAAGAAALKIEGRMKSPLYVAAVTDFYRRLLDGKLEDAAARAAAEEDLRTVFSRPWTRLYADSRANRDVIDTAQTGHRGAPVGTAERELRTKTGRVLLFTTTRELELHDGLQVDLPGTSRPYGFALDGFRIVSGPAPKDRYSIPAGAVAEVALPAEAPPIPAGARVYCASSQRVKRSYEFQTPRPGEFRERTPADISILFENNALRLSARTLPRTAGEPAAEAALELPGEFSPARNPAGTESAVRDAFSRLGDTRFALAELELRNPHGLFAPASVLNRARRELAAKLDEAVQAAADERVDAVVEAVEGEGKSGGPCGRRGQNGPSSAPAWSLLVDRAEYVSAFGDAEWAGAAELAVELGPGAPLAELERLRERLGPERVRLALPPVTRAWEAEALASGIRKLRAAGFDRWLLPGPAGWTFLEENGAAAGADIEADWTLPAFNRGALLQLFGMGAGRACLSPEDGAENMKRLLAEFGDRLTVVAYQDTPLMISESCPAAALAGNRCVGNCPKDGEDLLRSGKGEAFLVCRRQCRSFVLHQRPFCLAAHLPELAAAGARRLRADFRFRRYEPAEVRRLWNLLRAGQSVPHARSANYLRGI